MSTFTFGANVRSLTTGAGPNTAALSISIGDLVVVMVSCPNADTAVLVTDDGASGGNAYTKIIEWDDTADSERYVMYVCLSTTKTASNVSVSKTGTGFMNIHASRYTGAAAATFNSEVWGNGTGAQHFAATTPFTNSTAKTPVADNALIVGYSDSDDSTGSSSGAFTVRGTQGSGISTYDSIQTTAASAALAVAWGAAATGGQIGAIFYPDALGPPSPPSVTYPINGQVSLQQRYR